MLTESDPQTDAHFSVICNRFVYIFEKIAPPPPPQKKKWIDTQ